MSQQIFVISHISPPFVVTTGKLRIDCKSIAMNMLLKMSAANANKLHEHNMNRSACGRGGEHLWLSWNETTYDELFNAGKFEWHLVKQCDVQAMLMFCDKTLHCLCPYFSKGVFLLYGGGERLHMDQHKHDYMFPHLFNIQAQAVAK